jgi:3',5'-cyclic AMP phosphodiesterase CpdA
MASGLLDTPALLRDAVNTVLRRLVAIGPVDAVLLTGDISDDGSAESYAVARAELDRLGLPLLVVPGNHDAREPLRQAFRDQPRMPDRGQIDWVVDLDDTRVIGLDTLVEGQGGGRLQAKSLKFLRDALDSAGTRRIALALHHPPLRTGIRFMDAIELENRADLATILSETASPVRIVAGHVHGVFLGRIGPHSVATAPSTCSAFSLDRREQAEVGFLTGPTGFAVLDTGPDDTWTALPLNYGDGPFGF